MGARARSRRVRGGLASVAFLVTLLTVSTASAGTEASPELRDPRDVEDAVADILGVWFEPDPDGVRLTVKVASIPRQRPALLFVTLFTHDGARASPSLGFRNGGGLIAQQTWGGEQAGNDLLKATFRPGAPAYLTAVIPWRAYGGIAPGDVFRDIEAYSSYLREGEREWRAAYDKASEFGQYTVGTSGTAVAPVPSRAATPASLPQMSPAAILAACTLVGAGAGAWAASKEGARRTR
jgi:hypothetical protein